MTASKGIVPAPGDWGVGYKEMYRIPDGNLTSLQSVARTPVGIFYITKERCAPPPDLGPIFLWSHQDFATIYKTDKQGELWLVEYERSSLCEKASYQMILKYLAQREQVVSFWDKVRRFGYDRLYDYFREKEPGLMPRPYGSVLADSIILKEKVT